MESVCRLYEIGRTKREGEEDDEEEGDEDEEMVRNDRQNFKFTF